MIQTISVQQFVKPLCIAFNNVLFSFSEAFCLQYIAKVFIPLKLFVTDQHNAPYHCKAEGMRQMHAHLKI